LRVVVGRIGRAHGIRGEVSVDVRTDEPEVRFAPGAELLLEPGRTGPSSSVATLPATLRIEAARWHSGRLLVAFDGVHDRTGAETLRGLLLEVEVDLELTPEDPEEYYDHQLVGLAAVLLDGTAVGEVTEVVHLPGHELLAVRAVDGRELLVPFVTAIVPTIDLPGRRVLLDPPPGLLDDADADIDPDAAADVDPHADAVTETDIRADADADVGSDAAHGTDG